MFQDEPVVLVDVTQFLQFDFFISRKDFFQVNQHDQVFIPTRNTKKIVCLWARL